MAIIASTVWGSPYEVAYSKLYQERGEAEPVHEVWTSTARITVFDRPIFSPAEGVPWGWGYGERFEPRATREMWIDQDGSAGTPVEALPGEPKDLGHLFYDVTSIGYQLTEPRTACVIGAGGGRDVVTALAAGAERVDAVEINGAILELVRGPLADFSGHIYERPEVRAIESEGRSFLTRTERRYDLIQISLVDSWAATAAGAYALSENYLYTVEAIRMYLRRLAPLGVVSISRWTDEVQPFESVRLILLAQEALRQQGVRSPRDHLLFASGGNVGTLLLRNEPFDADAVRALDRIAGQRGFIRHWPPDPKQPPRSMVPVALLAGPEMFEREGLDVAPPVDDRPFFFQAAHILRTDSELVRTKGDMNLDSVGTLRTLGLALAVLTIALFLLPSVLARQLPKRGPGLWLGSAYFSLIGVAFMLLELPWMQKTILLVGHPSHAASVTIGTLLVGAGMGSAWTARLPQRAQRVLLLALPLVSGGVALAIDPLFEHALGRPLALRLAIAFTTFLVPGLLMGIAVPAGFVRFGDPHKTWFWALNGAASVLATVLSMVLAMAFGFLATTLLGAALYALACVVYLLHRSREQPGEQPVNTGKT